MNLSAPFIQRPIMTTLVMIATLIAGLICFKKLPISSMPNVNYPTISVKTSYPGALPDTVANSVSFPLEKQFMGISGLRLVNSKNILGRSSIILQFDVEKDMLTAIQQVQEALSSALTYLPPELPYNPVYRKVNPADQPIMYIEFTSNTIPLYDLYTYAKTLIGQRISMVSGISQVTVFGSGLTFRIQVDPFKLVSHGITIIDVASAIKKENVILPTGQLEGETEAPLIAVDGMLTKTEDYEQLIIAYRNGRPVRIQDIGRVIKDLEDNKKTSLFVNAEGEKPAVVLAVQKEAGANTVSIVDQIYELLKELKNQIPPSIDSYIFDQSIQIRAAIHDALITLVIALVLVVLVIFFFVGKISDAIIPSLVLPMSVIGTFIVMYSFGFTLNILSVLALTLAVGFIIDDAVVVMENIIRRVDQGESPLKASLEGSKEIGFTIVSMSMSLLAVFIPILFMGGLIGKIFKEFAVTLVAVTMISGIVSLTLTPMLCSLFVLRDLQKSQMSWVESTSNKVNNVMQGIYQKTLIKVLDYKFFALAVISSFLLAGALLLFIIPIDFVPDEDIGVISIYTQEIEGGSSKRMLEYESQVIKILQEEPSVDSFVAVSSQGEYRKGFNYVKLKPQEDREPIDTVIQNLNKKLKGIKGLQSFIKKAALVDLTVGQESQAAYQFAIQGMSKDHVYKSASALIKRMKEEPIFYGINSDLEINSPQINVDILHDQAALYGITSQEIEDTFSLSYSGKIISLVSTPTEQYNVILELLPEHQKETGTFNKIWLRSPLTSELVPLTAVTKWFEKIGATSVNHINQLPSVIISFNLKPGVPLDMALSRLHELSKGLLEPNVFATPIGAARTFKESVESSGYLLILTIFSIYIILGILYEDFVHPITILTTVPPAIFGGLLILYALDLSLSMYSFLGIILLIGIVMKNGIMIVDFAIGYIRDKGMTSREAIVEACLARFRPIMMTTVAAIFGALPIALGFGPNSEARRPLGLVIIGGLMISQLITIYITPTLYLMMESWRKREKKMDVR